MLTVFPQLTSCFCKTYSRPKRPARPFFNTCEALRARFAWGWRCGWGPVPERRNMKAELVTDLVQRYHRGPSPERDQSRPIHSRLSNFRKKTEERHAIALCFKNNLYPRYQLNLVKIAVQLHAVDPHFRAGASGRAAKTFNIFKEGSFAPAFFRSLILLHFFLAIRC